MQERRPSRRLPARARAPLRGEARPLAGLALAVAALLLAGAAPGAAPRALAAAGSGTAAISPSGAVAADSVGGWSITYWASEDFANQGGYFEVVIPAGWTPPQKTGPAAPGYVSWSDPSTVDSVTIAGNAIRVYLGTPPQKFLSGTPRSVYYGYGGPVSAAHAQTSAPATAVFRVRSQPDGQSGAVEIASSPSLSVVPRPVSHVRVVDAVANPIGALAVTADDTLRVYLRGYDPYENFARFVGGSWTVTGGIGDVAPASGTSALVTFHTVGNGYVAADSGAWADSTGLVTVAHGAYAGLASTFASPSTAGTPFAASAEAQDADGNRVVSGTGSSATVRFEAYADSVGASAADPGLVSDTGTLASGSWSGALTAQRAGTYWLAARDTLTGFESPRRRIVIGPAAPDHIALSPDSLKLTAGVPDTVAVRVHDVYGNPAPVPADEALTLWTARPSGIFSDLSGAQAFDVTVPAGADSARFRFTDTQTTSSPGQIRAIDANGTGPALGTAGTGVTTGPNVPTGTIALAATPDTLAADGADSTRVASGVIRDAYGNKVGVGERFTLAGTGLAPVTDDDPGAPGAQLLADSAGRVSAWLRAGTTAGPASAGVASERGSATGTAWAWLLAGAPAGAVVLSAPPDSLAADSVAILSITASGLSDANGNAVEDGEAFTVATTLGIIATADADPGTPGIQVPASGGAIAFILFGGDSLGTADVTAASVRGSASGATSIRLVPGGVSAGRSLVDAASPVPVGAAGSTILVTLRDAKDHPLPAVPAESLAVAVTGAAAAVAPLDAATDAAGAIRFRATATVADTGAVSVTARGVVLAATPPILFLHGPLDHYVVAGPPGPLTAGAPISLLVAARDVYENPLPDRSGDVLRPVVTSGGASVPDSVLLSAGEATVGVIPTLAAPLAVEARDDSSRASSYGPVAVNPGAPDRLTAIPPGVSSLAAGDSVAVGLLVTDANGNAAPAAAVAATIAAGSGSVSPASTATDPSGLAQVTLYAGGAPGPLTLALVATGSAAPDSVRADSITVTVQPGVVASIEIAAPAAGTAGAPAALTLTLRDAFGNVARSATPTVHLGTTTAAPAGDNVSWFAGPGAAGALVDSAGSDGATYAFAPADSGIAALAVRDTLAETIRLRVETPGVPAAQSGDLAVGPSGPAALAAVSGDGQSAVVDHTLAIPLRVRVRDGFGNLVPGAAVAFRVAAGNGFIDAVAGGAPDSLAAADAAGVATCDVARLGIVAGAGSDSFRAGLPAAASPEVLFAASALPDTASGLALSPAGLLLAPTTAQPVTVTARDRFGNPAPGTAVTFYLGAPARGALESLGGTSGTGTTQSGVTGASGALAVLYRAPSTAPSADSLFARGVSIPPVAVEAVTGSDTTVALQVLPDSSIWTAGVSVLVRVRAVDAYGNLVPADGATITMNPAGAVTWSPAAGPLVAGEFVTFGRDTLAETAAVAATHARGPAGSAGPVVVRPALPAGTIPIAAARDTLTADGRSTTNVTLGPVRDAYGNTVPAGTLILVSAARDSLIAPDARTDLPGLDLATAADGTAALVLRAATTAGPDTLRAATRAGSAAGTHAFTLIPPPALAYATGTLAPTEALPGAPVTFSLQVGNPGAAAIRLAAATTLSFGTGPNAVIATLASPTTVPAAGSALLAFTPVPVPAALTPGLYAPSLRAVGTDGAGDPFDFYLDLGGAQVSVIGLLVSPVGASPSPVPLGYGGLSLLFDVRNPSGSTATLVGASLAYSVGAFAESAPPSPAVPVTIPAGTTQRMTFTVRVPSSGLTPGTTVDATLTVTGSFASSTVVKASPMPVQFGVISAAAVAVVTGSATPARLLRGRTFAPTVRVRNGGASAVTLGRDSTRLVLAGPGPPLAWRLLANTVVAAGDSATLAFDSLAVGAAVPKGTYAASLLLRGTESGDAYADSIPLDPPGVDVVDPAILAVAPGSLSPAVVSGGQTRPLSFQLTNAGDVDFALGASTDLVLGAPVGATRALGAALTVPAGGGATLSFPAAAIGTSGSAGVAALTLAVRGTEDGVVRAEAIPAGQLDVRPPAAIAFVGGSTRPATTSAGSTVDFAVDVENQGGSPLTIDPAASRFRVADGVDLIQAPGMGGPVQVPPSGRVTLSFPSALVPLGFASQSYAVTLELAGDEWGLAERLTVVSPASELSVLEPVASLTARGIDVSTPVQIAPGTAALRAWGLVLEPLVPPGASVALTLSEVRVTLLADGAPAASPGAVIASFALRDRGGVLLAQATPGGLNPVPLALTGGRTLGAAPDTLFLDLALRPGADVQSVALSLAAAADIDATDSVSGAPAAITAPGGLPFTPLRSREITLFAKVHGYPNPFHAGREAVSLSYVLAADASVRVTIYTLLGDVVRELALAAGAPGGTGGLNEVPWDGRNGKGALVRPGVYVARIEGGGVSQSVKVGVLR